MSYEVIKLFNELPGCWERHCQRKYKNPLFADANSITVELVGQAQAKDLAELESFDKTFQDVLEKAVALPAHAQSDVVLGLKEQIDKLYESSATLLGDQTDKQKALLKLTEVVMKVIKTGADTDTFAVGQLEQETTARELHVKMLKHHVIADLLREESPIQPEELAAVVLIETPDAIKSLVTLFDDDQKQDLMRQCEVVVEKMKASDVEVPFVEDRMADLRLFSK
ncbi:MAG: hypothetical protein HOM11_02970 [Methylococcales bacterium]|jgi:hypothetical protein|nr:hypothetical protein [Methylococcales bacterium]MBT7442686.1 hypothetical protein [Methylococcales bacterium]